MSREAMEAVQDHSTIKDPFGLNIFVTIGRFVAADTKTGWASDRTIADLARCDKDSIRVWREKFEEVGEIETWTTGAGRGTRRYYRFLLPFNQSKWDSVIYDDEELSQMSRPEGDNNSGTINEGLSRRVDLLSQRVEEMSRQIELLSRSIVPNVPPRGGQEHPITLEAPKRAPVESTTRTREEAPTPNNDAALLELLRVNDLPEPETDNEWAALRSDEAITWIQATGYWPGYAALGLLRGRMGKSPSEDYLQRAWELWTLSGYKKNNIEGVLDWYGNISENPNWQPSDRFKPANGRHAQNGSGQSFDEIINQAVRDIEQGGELWPT